MGISWNEEARKEQLLLKKKGIGTVGSTKGTPEKQLLQTAPRPTPTPPPKATPTPQPGPSPVPETKKSNAAPRISVNDEARAEHLRQIASDTWRRTRAETAKTPATNYEQAAKDLSDAYLRLMKDPTAQSDSNLAALAGTPNETVTDFLKRRAKELAASKQPGIPPIIADTGGSELYELVLRLPDGIDLKDWSKQTTKQQLSTMQRSGLSKEDQWTLLNADVDYLETLGTIRDLQKNPRYLSPAKLNELNEKMIGFAEERASIKHSDLNSKSKQDWLRYVDEDQNALLAGVGLGTKATPGLFSTPGLFPTLGALATPGPKPTPRPQTTPGPRTTPLPQPGPTPEIQRRTPAGKYLGGNKIDLTDDLNDLMQKNATEFMVKRGMTNARRLAGRDVHAVARLLELVDFVQTVRTGKKLDIKNKEEWKFLDGMDYYYRGMKLRNDDPGNILFGYVGAALYGAEFLKFGAGVYQAISDLKREGKLGYPDGNHDDPRDTEMIQYGYDLFMEERGLWKDIDRLF